MYKLIMTDLDCTLLPVDQDMFIGIYFNGVAEEFAKYGYDKKLIINAVKLGSAAMYNNDGKRKNSEAFTKVFVDMTGIDEQKMLSVLDDYYSTDYKLTKQSVTKNPHAENTVRLMREKCEHLVVATQPMFPIGAVDERMSWTGINVGMFDHVTTYDTSSFCKPNTGYYEEIMARYDATPENTLMIGNDINEDMIPCKKLGISTFLLTEQLITHGHKNEGYICGGYSQLKRFLEAI